MHLLLCDRGAEGLLLQELKRAFRDQGGRVLSPGLIASEFVLQPAIAPSLIFSRQLLPNATPFAAESINGWAQHLFNAVTMLPEEQPWQCHIFPRYTARGGGINRCRLIAEALQQLLQRRRRHLLKCWQRTPTSFLPTHSFVQLVLTSPEVGFQSMTPAPEPFAFRTVVWPFPEGEIVPARDQAAPSRAFAKLLEAEQRLGRRIEAGESCVDLGAAPGSWSYVALRRGAMVTAIDRAPLRADLMAHPHLTFRQGDAFKYEPEQPVDWLLCDVIAAPERSVDLLLNWVRLRRTRRFVITLKFKGTEDYGILEPLKYALPHLCHDFRLVQLCANKNEVCAFGEVQP